MADLVTNMSTPEFERVVDPSMLHLNYDLDLDLDLDLALDSAFQPTTTVDDVDDADIPLQETYTTPDARWTALTARDPAADLAFVYCVMTTRIYCRPVCKARLPRRANVTFFSYPWDAAAAGFRPCKRCKPDVVALMPANAAHAALCRVVTAAVGAGGPFPRADELAARAGVSKWHLQRVFKRVYGVTPRAFAKVVAQNQPPPPSLLPALSPDASVASSDASSPMTPDSIPTTT